MTEQLAEDDQIVDTEPSLDQEQDSNDDQSDEAASSAPPANRLFLSLVDLTQGEVNGINEGPAVAEGEPNADGERENNESSGQPAAQLFLPLLAKSLLAK